MVTAFYTSAVLLLGVLGAVLAAVWLPRLLKTYLAWTGRRKYPQLWFEFPMLFLVWGMMFWIGIRILT